MPVLDGAELAATPNQNITRLLERSWQEKMKPLFHFKQKGQEFLATRRAALRCPVRIGHRLVIASDFAQYKQIQTLYLFTGPRGLAQELQARLDAGIEGEAAHYLWAVSGEWLRRRFALPLARPGITL